MVVGLAVVLAMLATLSLSGISGLRSYRHVLDVLDLSINHAPHRADLVIAVGTLFEPLLLEDDGDEDQRRFRHREFANRLESVRAELLDFQTKLEGLPLSTGVAAQTPVTLSLLAAMRQRLDRIERQHALLVDPSHEAETTRQLLEEVAALATLANRVPDPYENLTATLERARRVYRSRFLLVCAASAIVVVLFAGLVWCGYRWIFAPIRELYRGALRVAHGDFDFRVKLATHDEMSELADSFNLMTERFQQITRELDQQVRERSRQLVRSERLAGVGFLAAGVAHEINNPLQAITQVTESLKGRVAELSHAIDGDQADVMRHYLDMIEREASRCQTITARLLDFARGQDTQRMPTDIVGLIREVVELVGHMSRFRDRRIRFEAAGPCTAEVNAAEIKQVVLNLVANALESTSSGGSLTITVDDRADELLLTFRDDGCGMTPEVLENLFEPFFTRKTQGQGTGLGLSISHRIVTDHGGTIEAESEGPGRGSVFRIRLPRRSPQRTAA